MKFIIELLGSPCEQFKSIGNDVNAAEQWLIQQWSPCFNVSHNKQPTPRPPAYFPPNARLRCSRSLNKLIREAERAVKYDSRLCQITAPVLEGYLSPNHTVAAAAGLDVDCQ